MKDKETNKIKKPWPTKEAMIQVYEQNLWGDNATAFYSGEGSHLEKIVAPYIAAITTFLNSFKSPISLCDLGCGDFNVGRQLVSHTQQYVAVDIVPDLIAHNKERFIVANLAFRCLDIVADDLPAGDCAILRQVLQHLSNAEILTICKKLHQFKYVIVTEHVPEGTFTPNLNIISGQGTRMKKKSGLNLLVSPFNLKVKQERELLSIPLDARKGEIRTTLYTMF